jgi:hypothetical protein
VTEELRDSLVARRLAAQLLSGPPARTSEQVVDRLLAVQGQDQRGVRLSIRSRSTGLTVADVDEALTSRRSLVLTWLNRGTLHLVTPEDYWWLHPLTTPQLVTANNRRLRQEGVDPVQADLGVEVVTEAVTLGPQTRSQLRSRLDSAGVPTRGQALVHVLLAASLRGRVVRGPMVGGEHAYVDVHDWLGDAPAPLDREEALARLARRYLAGHGPAEAGDLARWAGIPLREARLALVGIASQTVAYGDGLVDLADRSEAPTLPGPRLLGAYDPILLGWVSRQLFVGEHKDVVTSNGLFRPVALVDGRVVATWSLSGGTLAIRTLETVKAAALRSLKKEATEVLRFLGQPDGGVVLS